MGDGCAMHLLTSLHLCTRWLLARRPDDAWQEAICNYSFKWAWSWHNFFHSITSAGSYVGIYPTCLYISNFFGNRCAAYCCALRLRFILPVWLLQHPDGASKKIPALGFLQTSQLAGEARVLYVDSQSRDLTLYPPPPEELALINDSIMWDLQLLDINGCIQCE